MKILSVVMMTVILSFGLVSCNKKETVKPRRGPVVEAVYGLGTVMARRTFLLRSAVATRLTKLFVREGDEVKKGDALLMLDESGKHASPLTGVVNKIYSEEGENIIPQKEIISVLDLTDRYISVSLEQQGALRVQKKQAAVLNFESMRGKKFSGFVRSIYPQEGQFIVYIEVKDLPSEILPGMTADVAIEVGKKDSALLVPATAIMAGKVTAIKNGKTTKIPVEVGVVDGEWAEVTASSLSEQDEILLTGK